MRERHWKGESGIWNLVPLKILLESFIEGLTWEDTEVKHRLDIAVAGRALILDRGLGILRVVII